MSSSTLDPDKLRESFSRVKSDIFTLQSQILALTREIKGLKRTLLQTDSTTDRQTETQTHREVHTQYAYQNSLPTAIPSPSFIDSLSKNSPIQTNLSQKETNSSFQQTHNLNFPQVEPLKTPNLQVSTGNRGVPTDRQTNQQTDKPLFKRTLDNSSEFSSTPITSSKLNEPLANSSHQTDPHKQANEDKITHIAKVSELVNSLDTLKKDIRSMFKRLTPQEMLVYSTIYQLSDEGFTVDYPIIAEKTSLSESSIRDYILKLSKKGVPLDKTKENNKRIILSVPQDFKKVASLSTIISLREL